MGKGILSSYRDDLKLLFYGSSRNLLQWNFIALLLMFIAFNYFTLTFVSTALLNNIDSKLLHETDRLQKTFNIVGDSIIFISTTEIDEKDFNVITEHPFFLEIYSQNGDLLYRAKNSATYPYTTVFIPETRGAYTLDYDSEHPLNLRTLTQPLLDSNNSLNGFIKIATPVGSLDSIIWESVQINLYLFPLTAFIILIVSLILVRRSRKPLMEVIQKAEEYTFHQGIYKIEFEADQNDILGRLRDTLNNLFLRIDESFSQMRQFTDNASHQLMNPLTALKTELEFILKKDRSSEDYTDALRGILLQTDKMIAIVKTLLIISRLSYEEHNRNNIFNVSRRLEDIISGYNLPDRIKATISEELYVRGTPDIFEVLTRNLIDNALKYSPSNATVNVILEKYYGSVALKVADLGIGVPDDEKEKIFLRFYRSHMSEVLGSEGYGLGLCLAKTIAKDLGGDITVYDNNPCGSVFELRLPLIDVD